MQRKIILAGGTGFIGTALLRKLIAKGYSPVILTRGNSRVEKDVEFVHWDGDKVEKEWKNKLENSFAVINLAGESINKVFTAENRAKIISSRVNAVVALSKAVRSLKNPPEIWAQASAIGYYGNTGNTAADEYTPRGNTFLSEVVEYWERSFIDQSLPNIRKVIIRIGQVLGNGGMLPELTKFTKLFLGGAIGNGKQWVSWIHIDDLTEIFIEALERDCMGIYNGVAPSPVTNKEFMQTLRKTLSRPWSPPVPKFVAKLGGYLLGTDPELLFSDTKCVPKRLIEDDFNFKFTALKPALEDLLKNGRLGG